MNKKFKKGDKVIVNGSSSLEDGTEVVVLGYNDNPNFVGVLLPKEDSGHNCGMKFGDIKGRGWWVGERYCSLAKPHFKFKVGDKVQYQNKDANMQVGVIKFIDENGDCSIRFDPKENPKMQCSHSILSSETAFMVDNYYELYKEDPVVLISISACPKARRTTASYYEDGKRIAEGVARCNPEDKWDATIGAQLAFRRLLGELDCKVMINAEDILDAYKELLGMED